MRTLRHRSDAAVLLLELVDRKKSSGNPGWLGMAYRRTHRSDFYLAAIRGLLCGVQAAERSSFSIRSASNEISSSFAVLPSAVIMVVPSAIERLPEAI